MSQVNEKIDIANIPYKHRTAAADLLISKAHRLVDLSELHYRDIGDKEIRQAQKAISFYDMALFMMKPYDLNYQTILNWKCLTLIGIGQFEDACKWYEELIRISIESEGPKSKNATRDLAKEQLKKYSGKSNCPIKPVDESEIRILDDPPFCLWAERFCDELQKGKYKKAHQFFSHDLAKRISQTQLKESWLSLTDSADSDVNIYLDRYEIGSDDDEDNYIGWCYFIVSSENINEAISFDVYQTESLGYEIHSIEFGRP